MTRFLAGALAALAISFAAPALAATPPKPAPPPQTAWDHVDRVVVIGDLHGDYDKFHDMLLKAGLINRRDSWSGGKTHLVQLGDVPDRAPDTRKILDLLIKLEPQARKAGGYVHALIGNHEAMNMQGDLRYTTPGEFAAFADKNSARVRDAFYQRVIDLERAKAAAPPAPAPGATPAPATTPAPAPVFDEAYRAKFDQEHPLGWVEHAIAWSPGGVYGRWILTHSAIIRIDDTLYMHAGISPEFQPFEVDAMNAAVTTALRNEPEVAGGPHDILWSEQSPLWYRGMAQNPEATEAANVAATLAHYHVKRVILGHTKQYSMVNSRFDGAVILTDIGVKPGCVDPRAFLIKEGDRLTTIYRGQTLPLQTSGAGHDAYVAAITAIDQANKVPTACAIY